MVRDWPLLPWGSFGAGWSPAAEPGQCKAWCPPASKEQPGSWFACGWGLSSRGEHPGLLMIAVHHPGVQSLPGELAGTKGIPPRRASPRAELRLFCHHSPSTLLGGQPTSGSARGTSQPPSFPVCTQHSRSPGWLAEEAGGCWAGDNGHWGSGRHSPRCRAGLQVKLHLSQAPPSLTASPLLRKG